MKGTAMATTVLRDFSATLRRWTAGEDVPEGAIPAPELAALAEGGFVTPPESPAAPAADPEA